MFLFPSEPFFLLLQRLVTNCTAPELVEVLRFLREVFAGKYVSSPLATNVDRPKGSAGELVEVVFRIVLDKVQLVIKVASFCHTHTV